MQDVNVSVLMDPRPWPCRSWPFFSEPPPDDDWQRSAQSVAESMTVAFAPVRVMDPPGATFQVTSLLSDEAAASPTTSAATLPVNRILLMRLRIWSPPLPARRFRSAAIGGQPSCPSRKAGRHLLLIARRSRVALAARGYQT